MPPRFDTAPPWFRVLLRLEDAALYTLRNHLPTQAHLHGDDEATADYALNERLGIYAAERMVPGGNASPYMVQHASRYLWAMDICRGKQVVDLGSGDGYGTLLLSWVARSAVGFDVSEEAVAAARRRYPGVEYRVVDLSDQTVIPEAEIGVCFEVVEHVPHAERILYSFGQRFRRLLLSMPNPIVGGSHINPHHVNDWPLSTLRAHLRHAGATHIRGYHQGLYSWRIRRGATALHPFWLLDVSFER